MSKVPSKSKLSETTYRVVEFDSSVDASNFTCGNSTLDAYIKKFAKQNHQASISGHYMALTEDGSLIGFFVISPTNISPQSLPKENTKGLPKFPYAAGLIAQLAIDNKFKKRGLGESLLLAAMDKILEAKKILGCFAFLTDAKDLNAENFYSKYGYLILDTSQGSYPKRMYLLAKTYEEALKKK